ncbi:hypothetical protein RMR21_015630 [Agrobacterium sp. rho-8.1]|nr:hypothetical protein [Agrobacterium sp. rho-8.1]
MKIQYEIAEGHKRGENGLNEYLKTNPGISAKDATTQWIEKRFGAWITTIISGDYKFQQTSSKSFIVDFTYEDDGRKFLAMLGGHEMEA